MYFGSLCQSGLLPALLRPPVAALPPSPGAKRFLPLASDPVMTVNLVPGLSVVTVPQRLAGNDIHRMSGYQERDPVQCARNDTSRVTLSPGGNRVACSLCKIRFNSQIQASAHYGGTKHAKKLKATKALKCESGVAKGTTRTARPRCPPAAGGTAEGRRERSRSVPGREEETEEEKARRLLYCSLCEVAVNSPSQLEAHSCGTKHKTMLEARSGNGTIKSFPRPGVKGKTSPPANTATGLQDKVFRCETCDVLVNSETQLKQHISSRRHKDRAAGKLLKATCSPYSKGPTAQPEKSGLKKEPPQPPGARLLPAYLAAVVPSALLFQPQPPPPAEDGPLLPSHASPPSGPATSGNIVLSGLMRFVHQQLRVNVMDHLLVTRMFRPPRSC